jgi:hypothetical protein
VWRNWKLDTTWTRKFFKSILDNYNNNQWTIFNRISIFVILHAVKRCQNEQLIIKYGMKCRMVCVHLY